jgi:membrane protease YdiL (CAAX protease family)
MDATTPPTPPTSPSAAPLPPPSPDERLPDAPPVPLAGPVAAPDVPRRYGHALTGLRGATWRGILAILAFVVGFLLLSATVGSIGLIIDVSTGTITPEQLQSAAIPITPSVLLFTNLALVLAIPLATLLQWGFFGVRPRFLSSVEGRFRWRWAGRLALVVLPVWAVYVLVLFLLEPGGEVRLDGTAIALIAIVLLTTPLQAAGEEYGMRGLVQRSVGGWFRSPRAALIVGAVISGVLFCSAHFAGDPWLIAYYFLFGVAMSVAAWGTGGIEAPIVIHAINNVCIFLPAAVLGGLDQGIDRSAGSGGPIMLVPMAMVFIGAAIAVWWGRRSKVVVEAVPPANALYAPPSARV